jgi:integrase
MKSRKALKIVSFKLEKRKDKKTGLVKIDNVPILVDFKFDGQRAIYPIGYRIDFDKWNHEEQRVKRNNFNQNNDSAGTINKRINNIDVWLPKIYDYAVTLDLVITKKYLWTELLKKIDELEHPANDTDEKEELKTQKTIPEYIQLFIDTEKNLKDWSESTVKKMNTLKTHILGYCEENSRKLYFNDITEDFLESYINYQRITLKLNNTTNLKYMKLLKWFLNWSIEPKESNNKKPYNTNLSYKTFKFKFKGTKTADYQQNIIFLSWKELMHFVNLDLSKNKTLAQVRDIYCFCCLTSLRYSDIEHLKKSDFKTDEKGNIYIELLTVKTDDKLTIELNKYAVAILLPLLMVSSR